MINAFDLTLLADSVTLVIVLVATIRRPILSYQLIAGVAICATGFALLQVITGRANVFAFIFTAVLVAAMTVRIVLNLRRVSRTGRRR